MSSDALRREAAVLAKELGIRPLRAGETRPDGFYLRDHVTGEPLVRNRLAVVPSSTEGGVSRQRVSVARRKNKRSAPSVSV
jgi:hypothetical protein